MDIRIKKAKYLEGYQMSINDFYFHFDEVAVSSTEDVSLYNRERFICLVGKKYNSEVLELCAKQSIQIRASE